jgi:nucleosome assembly protein 1-like 1
LDYNIGEDIKEKLIPRAIDWFTGAALEYEEIDEDDLPAEYDDEFSEEEDEEEDEDEDEDDDEQGDKPKAEPAGMALKVKSDSVLQNASNSRIHASRLTSV